MSDFDPAALAALLPPSYAEALPARWAEYAAEHADPNPYSFVAWLFTHGHLPAEIAKGALTSGRAVLTLSAEEGEGEDGEVPVRAELEPLGVIGRGAMGEVLVVRDAGLRRTVALKRSRPEKEVPKEVRAAFLREAQITAQLDHPGIVAVHGLQSGPDGELAYTMKLVHGQTLEEVIAEATREAMARPHTLPRDPGLPERLEILLSVCDAIAYAHAQGVVHRDLKPENIMVAQYGEVLVLDWGVARLIPNRDLEREEGQIRIVGTPLYMAPEQAFGAPFALRPAADQYSLGLILFELISLRRANPGQNPLDAIQAARDGEVEALRPPPKVKAVPRELAAIVARATQRKPARRYPSVQAFAEDLRRYLRDEEVQAAPDRGVQRLQRWISRNRELALAIGFGLALLVVVTGLGLSALGEARVAASESRAAAREAALSTLGTVVARQVATLDARLQHFEAALAGIVFAAEEALGTPGTGAPPYFGLDPGGAPADLAPSALYGGGVSLEQADLYVAAGVPRASVTDELAQVAGLNGPLRAALYRGASAEYVTAPERAAALARDPGLPLVWTYVATERGVIANFPGTDTGYPQGYDPRSMGWYRVGRGQPRPVWSVLEVDESGMGLLLTVSQGLHSAQGESLGVGALDVAFPYLIETLLDAPALDGVAETFLVDGEGRVIIRSSQKAQALDSTAYSTPPFPYLVSLPEDRTSPGGGWAEFMDGGRARLLHWRPVHTLPWTYVVVGERDALFARAATSAASR